MKKLFLIFLGIFVLSFFMPSGVWKKTKQMNDYVWGYDSSDSEETQKKADPIPTIPAKDLFKPVQTSKIITLRPGEKYTWTKKTNYKKYVWQNADGFPTDGGIVKFGVYNAERDYAENITNVTQTGTIAISGD